MHTKKINIFDTTLRDGEQVEYEHTQGEKGLLATSVKRLVIAGAEAHASMAAGNAAMRAF